MLSIIYCGENPTTELISFAKQHHIPLVLFTKPPEDISNCWVHVVDSKGSVLDSLNYAISLALPYSEFIWFLDDLSLEDIQCFSYIKNFLASLPRIASLRLGDVSSPDLTLYCDIFGTIFSSQVLEAIGSFDLSSMDRSIIGYEWSLRAKKKGYACYAVPAYHPPRVVAPVVLKDLTPSISDTYLAPDQDSSNPMKWLGPCHPNPLQYKVTVSIPHYGRNIRMLKLAIDSWDLQTVKPYIHVVDTGSPRDMIPRLLELERENIEIHFCRWHGHFHASQFVALACEHALADCRSEYLIFTHNDVFPITPTIAQELISQCKASSPVIGYEMSPRMNPRWKGMVSHTLTCIHVPTIDRIRATWNMRWLKSVLGVVEEPGWPDTEVPFNECLRLAGIQPKLIGSDQNHQRQLTHHFDHVRSYVSGELYSPDYHEKSSEWVVDVLAEAEKRLSEWRRNGVR